MTKSKRLLHELNLNLFSNLTPSNISEWEKIATFYDLNRGEQLYSLGQNASVFYIVLAGGISIAEYTTGKAVVTLVCGVGDYIALRAISHEYKHTTFAQAIAKTQIIGFQADRARVLLVENGEIALELLDYMNRQVHDNLERMCLLSKSQAEQRLAYTLLYFYRKLSNAKADTYLVEARISQRDIADFAGTSVETANRFLRRWEKQGWIKLTWMRFDILDPTALKALARQG